ncbi:MAG TPA: transposase [Candidatus Paceibacterota bacterium]|nr:transposase [Candidatus Paceibacterota bacterium]
MEFYHLINRGVEKRDVFLDDGDYLRFIHDLYVFNDRASAPNYMVKARRAEHRRALLVQIHAFALMSNHYHLLVTPLQDDSLSLFMRKLNMGYAKYMNEKYDRSGVLWQGTFRKIRIKRDAHFQYIPYYIHLNPLDYTHPNWRSGTVASVEAALAALRAYRWSSYRDFNGIKNFPSVLHTDTLKPILGNTSEQNRQIAAILSDPAVAAHSDALE